jgi:hypothetical protein
MEGSPSIPSLYIFPGKITQIELVEWNEITITNYISIASQAIEEKGHLKLDRRKDILTRQFTWQSCPAPHPD